MDGGTPRPLFITMRKYMRVLAVVKLKYATIEKPCENFALALNYIKSMGSEVISYEIKLIGG